MNNAKPIRIAQIMGKWVGGGVESVVMNYYRHIDRKKIQFDFICDEDSTNIPFDEIESLGGKVIICPPYQKIFKYQKELKRILVYGNYKIVHSHINTLSAFSLLAAYRAKVKIRIAHSHSTTSPKELKRNIMKIFLRPFSKLFATHYMACSEQAGRWQFGNKTFDKGLVTIINNAIDLEKFKYDPIQRKTIRKKLGISEDTIVLGHVGRFCSTKNQLFIIDLFYEYHKDNKDSKLVLIGQGPLENQINNKIEVLNLKNDVFLLGQKEDVYRYYNIMDLFVFPSLYEGLGMVAIEAQVNQLPCIISFNVPNMVEISNGIIFVNLNDDVSVWNNKIKVLLKNGRRIVYNNHIDQFDIKRMKQKLENIYIDLSNSI